MKYTGALSQPIKRKRIGLLALDDAYQAEAARVTGEMFSKLPALFEAHSVPDGNWMRLALELAKSHVPGFKVIDPAGRKTEWSIADKAEFRLDVDTIIEQRNLTVVEAIKLAIRLDKWKEKASSMAEGTIGAFESHYYKADMRFVEVVKEARAWQALQAPSGTSE